MGIHGFDRYKVWSAAEVLPTFTVRDLSAQAVVSEQNVQKIIQRSDGIFERVGQITQGRGRPSIRYRVHPGRIQEFHARLLADREEIAGALGLSAESDRTEQSPALISLQAAEYELEHRLPIAVDPTQRSAILERARDLLVAVRKSGAQFPEIESRQVKAEALLKELSTTLLEKTVSTSLGATEAVATA